MHDFSSEQVLKAIKGSKGNISKIAKKLKCNWHTAKKYIESFEETKKAYNDENEQVLDIADEKLYQLVEEGDLGAIKWLQSTKGKHRGYVQRQEHTGKDGDKLQTVIYLPKKGEDVETATN